MSQGEAVGFPACQQAGKALECGSFRDRKPSLGRHGRERPSA